MRVKKSAAFTITLDDLNRELANVCAEVFRKFEAQIGPTDPAAREAWKLDPDDTIIDTLLDPTATGTFIGLPDDTCGALRNEGLDMRYNRSTELAGVLKIAMANFHTSARAAARAGRPHPDIIEYLAGLVCDHPDYAILYIGMVDPMRPTLAALLQPYLRDRFKVVGGDAQEHWPRR